MSGHLRLPKRLQGLDNTHDRSKVQEAGLAKKLGGRTTIGSGNKDEKGDVRLKGLIRVECKNTQEQGFRVTAEMLAKLSATAVGAGELPVMQIDLGVKDGVAMQSFYVLPMSFESVLMSMAEQYLNPPA